MNKSNDLHSRLGHTFSDATLLDLALAHRSVGKRNNERLEFLGDSLLNFIITDALYKTYPNVREGKLTRLRANLVKGDTLAELAKEFRLGEFLYLGEGELKSGGYHRASILADAVEAIIAAIYLDSDLATCKQCVLSWFATRLDNLLLSETVTKDPKTLLQEYLQQHKMKLPEYKIIKSSGEQHDQLFLVECRIESLSDASTATGSSKKIAEKKAAKKMLGILGIDSGIDDDD